MLIPQEKNKIEKQVYGLFRNNFYESQLHPKKGEITSQMLLKNYPNIEKRKIHNSLMLRKPEIYSHIHKAVRFWGCFCNYAYPSIKLQKMICSRGEFKKRKNTSEVKDDFSNKKDVKLPQLYTNSNSRLSLFHYCYDFSDKANNGIKKVNSAIDLFKSNLT